MSSKEIINELGRMRVQDLREVYRYLNTRADVIGSAKGADEYIAKMNEIMGADIRVRCRERHLVWGRNMVAYRMVEDGWSLSAIGRAFGMDHSSIIHARDSVKMMLKNPRMYYSEMKVWNEFKNRMRMESVGE